MAWTTPQNFTTGQLVDEADMDAISDNLAALLPVDQVEWDTWSPTYVNITTTSGTVVANYTQIGKLVIAEWQLTFGASTSIDGSSPTVSLPVTGVLDVNAAAANSLCTMNESGVAVRFGVTLMASTTTMQPWYYSVGSGGSAGQIIRAAVSSTAPFTWGSADFLHMRLIYEAA